MVAEGTIEVLLLPTGPSDSSFICRADLRPVLSVLESGRLAKPQTTIWAHRSDFDPRALAYQTTLEFRRQITRYAADQLPGLDRWRVLDAPAGVLLRGPCLDQLLLLSAVVPSVDIISEAVDILMMAGHGREARRVRRRDLFERDRRWIRRLVLRALPRLDVRIDPELGRVTQRTASEGPFNPYGGSAALARLWRSGDIPDWIRRFLRAQLSKPRQ